MADKVGHILVLSQVFYGSVLTFEPPDLYVVDFEKSDDEFIVTRFDQLFNSEILTDKEPLTVFNPPHFFRQDTGHSFIDAGGSRVTFRRITTFPYYEKVGGSPPGEETVNDLSVQIVSIKNTSGAGVADGEVEVLASGTNNPFSYSLTDPTDFDDYFRKFNPKFTGLPAGKYSVWAKDDKGFITFVNARIETDTSAQYNVIWRLDFIDRVGQMIRVDILKRDYIGIVNEVDGSGSPLTSVSRADTRDADNLLIIPTEIEINLIAKSADDFVEISRGDEKTFLAKKYKHDGSDYVLEFTGYVDPSSYSDSVYQVPYYVSILAKDGLGDIGHTDFVYGQYDTTLVESSDLVGGDVSQLDAIKVCMDKLSLQNGYRVACNVFAENHDTVDKSPLEQTYFNGSIYTNEQGNKVERCDVVVKDILTAYGAIMFSYGGYWYIVRLASMLDDVVNYIEYDQYLTYVDTSSWNPRIEFGRPSEVGKWRFAAAQSRVFTRLYRSILLRPELKPNENGILPNFDGQNVLRSGDKFEGFRGYSLFTGNDDVREALVTRGISNRNTSFVFGEDSIFYYQIGMLTDIGRNGESLTYISTSNSITYRPSFDKIRLKVSLILNSDYWFAEQTGNFNELPPYFKLRWSLKVGDFYLTSSGSWSATEYINEEFVEEFNEDYELDREYYLFNDQLNVNPVLEKDFTLRFYSVSMTDKHASFEDTDGIIDYFKSSLSPSFLFGTGTRRIMAVELEKEYTPDTNSADDFFNPYYYELQESNEPDDGYLTIRPFDFSSTNEKVWKLVTTRSYRFIRSNKVYFYTNFDYMNIDFIQNDEPYQYSQEYVKVLNRNNIDVLEKEIKLIDLPTDYRNSDKIVLNATKYLDGTPTDNWSIVGTDVTKKLQDHLLDWLGVLYRACRSKIRGTALIEGNMSLKNVLIDVDDNNRIYLPVGVSLDEKQNEFRGELIEIGSDDIEDSSAFTIGFKQEAVT